MRTLLFDLLQSLHEQRVFPSLSLPNRYCEAADRSTSLEWKVKVRGCVWVWIEEATNSSMAIIHLVFFFLFFLPLPFPPFLWCRLCMCVYLMYVLPLCLATLRHIHILLAICLSTSRNDDDILLSFDIAHQCPTTFFYPSSSDQTRSSLLVLSFSFTLLLLYSFLKYACLQTKHTPISSHPHPHTISNATQTTK